LNLKTFVAAVRRYVKTLVAVAGVVFAVGLAWIILTPAKYVSTTQLMVSISGSTTAAAYQNDEVVAGRINSYIALLTSDAVSQRVIDKLGLSMTAPELAAEISATNVPPKTSVIDVAVTDESPARARLIADTLASEFINYTNALETPTGEDGQKVHTTVVSPASEPRERRAERVILGVLAGLTALLLGSVAVWIRSRIDPVVRTADQAAATAGVPVIGCVTSAQAVTVDELNGYRRLRTRLRTVIDKSGRADDLGHVWVVASATGEVDAATAASNLGRAMELAGSRSIVLDAYVAEADVAGDARTTPYGSDPLPNRIQHEDGEPTDDDKPKADNETAPNDGADAPVLQAPEQGGRHESGRVVPDMSVEPSIQRGDDGLPDTVSIGAWFDDPNRLATTATAELIEKLRSQYARVIIAVPPALFTSTASVVGEYADGVVLLVALGTTRRRDLSSAAEELRSVGSPLSAAVLVCNEDGVAPG
jgi:capsular polysaccharide biosynthesis protein